ncbi:hypothetical protein BDV98DRAFT_561716 [Pterulicium gracile]|uniref:Uncharacterized protein n=1 Tax=Pterulicium gracile TaxID=1884261 RepID=A0A5C3QV41_9AGAR|nr:hypothetical protein BDV98DRAFT_561716 [Pterula gracilis]
MPWPRDWDGWLHRLRRSGKCRRYKRRLTRHHRAASQPCMKSSSPQRNSVVARIPPFFTADVASALYVVSNSSHISSLPLQIQLSNASSLFPNPQNDHGHHPGSRRALDRPCFHSSHLAICSISRWSALTIVWRLCSGVCLSAHSVWFSALDILSTAASPR